MAELQEKILDFFLLSHCKAGNAFFSFISKFGADFVPVVIILFVFWCVDRRKGFTVFLSVTFGSILSRLFGLICRFPRPFALFEKYKGAMTGSAAGNSFPSTGTAFSSALFGSVAYVVKSRFVKYICIFLFLATAASELYFTVHWPTDILGGLIIGFFCVAVLVPRFSGLLDSGKTGSLLVWGFVFSLTGLCHVFLIDSGADAGFLQNTFYRTLAVVGSCIAGFCIETKTVRSEVAASLWKRLLMFAAGLAGLYFIFFKSESFLPDGTVSDFLRYYASGLWCMLIWPAFSTLFRLSDRRKKAAV